MTKLISIFVLCPFNMRAKCNVPCGNKARFRCVEANPKGICLCMKCITLNDPIIDVHCCPDVCRVLYVYVTT